MTPKVTVLVPVYRGADLVGAAIESTLAQTFSDFELLLVDDCSPDDSVAVIESYADPRIRLVRNERNLGQIGTLNRGLAEARGAYVARLDQDDRSLPERLERQVAVLDAEPRVGLVATWMTVVDGEGRRMAELRGRLDDSVDFVYDALIDHLRLGHPSVMFRRDAVRVLGGYDDAVPLAEDKDLWRRLLLAGYEARIVPESLVLYLLHAGQQSQQSADAQQASAALGYARFVCELSPALDPEPIRLLLKWDSRYWDGARQETARRTVDDLERLLADATARLGLDAAQSGELERRIRARALTAAHRSWRSSRRAHREAAPAILAFALRCAGDTIRRREQKHYRRVRTIAPALRVAFLLKHSALRWFGEPGRLRLVKRIGRRSPRAIALYHRLGGR